MDRDGFTARSFDFAKRNKLQKKPALKNTIGKLFAAGLTFFLVAGFLSAYLPKMFVVQNVVVNGTRPEIASEIENFVLAAVRDKAVLFDRTNIFLVPKMFLEFELPNRFPLIKTVQILRELPGTIVISVQEKIPIALILTSDKYLAIDPDGSVFEEISMNRVKENNYPVIRDERNTGGIELNGRVINPEILGMLHEIRRQLPDRFAVDLTEIAIPAIGTQELHVSTSEKWKLLLDTTRSLENQFAVLEKVFTEQIDAKERTRLDYVDLRTSGKAFYKFQN